MDTVQDFIEESKINDFIQTFSEEERADAADLFKTWMQLFHSEVGRIIIDQQQKHRKDQAEQAATRLFQNQYDPLQQKSKKRSAPPKEEHEPNEDPKENTTLPSSKRQRVEPNPEEILYVESKTAEQTGGTHAWASVVDEAGNDLVEQFYTQIAGDQRTEIKDWEERMKRRVVLARFDREGKKQLIAGDVVGCLIALRIAIRKLQNEPDRQMEIRSRSKLLVESWSKGHIKVSTMQQMEKEKAAYLREMKRLREEFEQLEGRITLIV